jgi:D-ribose pyranose/furanose isomerase RbsD
MVALMDVVVITVVVDGVVIATEVSAEKGRLYQGTTYLGKQHSHAHIVSKHYESFIANGMPKMQTTREVTEERWNACASHMRWDWDLTWS